MQYEYRCTSCGRIRVRSFPLAANPDKVLCVLCGNTATRFMGSARPQITYKGSGWAGRGHGETHPSEVRSTDPFDYEGVDK